MKKIIDYIIVYGPLPAYDKLDTIDRQIKRYIKNGWQPLGGASSYVNNSVSNAIIFQVMVKYEE
jgi:hypothetical protein